MPTDARVLSPLTPFLGEEFATDYDQARVVIVPIPFEATTTYRQGCQQGPEALLTASAQVEVYDEELDWEIGEEVGIATYGAIADTRDRTVTSAEMLAITETTLRQLINEGKWAIAIGGEHSITEAVVAAYQATCAEPFTVIQIDAHSDLRYEYEGSLYNHACVMHRILDRGLPTLQIGIRSLCKEEADLIKSRHLPVFWARHLAQNPQWIDQALAAITTKKVFLTIDLDGLDPTLLPGVGTPEPGGLNWYSLTTFLRRVFENHQVLGFDVMELAPIPDSVVSEFTAAKLVYKLIGYQGVTQGWKQDS